MLVTEFCASPAGNIYNHVVRLVAYLDHDPIHPQLWCAVHQPLQVYVQIVKDQVQLLWLIQNLHQPVEARQTQFIRTYLDRLMLSLHFIYHILLQSCLSRFSQNALRLDHAYKKNRVNTF